LATATPAAPPAAAAAERTSGANTPNAANALAAAANATAGQPAAAAAQVRGQQQQQRHYLVEFNHAITFVNKIKQRYNTDTETYKLFLEILQTYQRDGRHIEDVSRAFPEGTTEP
jgi:paired amphipathic helix protein Sin3a